MVGDALGSVTPHPVSRVPPSVDAVLRYWFADARGDPAAAARRMAFWFSADAHTDAQIAQRFGETMAAAAQGRLAPWEAAPSSRLALVLALDQFPRNVHRGTPAAFAHDEAALAITRRGLAAGDAAALDTLECAFFLMPFQHAEDLAAQREGAMRFDALHAQAAPEWRAITGDVAKYAHLHLGIVERFGRFPHRNAILGRDSTPAERAFLESGAESFGQDKPS